MAVPPLPKRLCCCAVCPIPDPLLFSAVEIFGNAATEYTDATVPDLADGTDFIATFGASAHDQVWYYDDGAGIEYWFFVRVADGTCSPDNNFFDTYGYNANIPGNLNNETYCCETVTLGGTYSAVGADTTWEAFL